MSYAIFFSVKSVINVGEKIGKTVGRRVPVDSGKYGAGLQRLANEVNRTMRRGICPKGVYRFRSHEEADAWMTRMQVERAKRN
jgi:hypothetical protein